MTELYHQRRQGYCRYHIICHCCQLPIYSSSSDTTGITPIFVLNQLPFVLVEIPQRHRLINKYRKKKTNSEKQNKTKQLISSMEVKGKVPHTRINDLCLSVACLFVCLPICLSLSLSLTHTHTHSPFFHSPKFSLPTLLLCETLHCINSTLSNIYSTSFFSFVRWKNL